MRESQSLHCTSSTRPSRSLNSKVSSLFEIGHMLIDTGRKFRSPHDQLHSGILPGRWCGTEQAHRTFTLPQKGIGWSMPMVPLNWSLHSARHCNLIVVSLLMYSKYFSYHHIFHFKLFHHFVCHMIVYLKRKNKNEP